jgi:hypothetical protein
MIVREYIAVAVESIGAETEWQAGQRKEAVG